MLQEPTREPITVAGHASDCAMSYVDAVEVASMLHWPAGLPDELRARLDAARKAAEVSMLANEILGTILAVDDVPGVECIMGTLSFEVGDEDDEDDEDDESEAWKAA